MASIKSVLITDEIESQCVDILKRSGIEVTQNTALAKDKAALAEEIKKHDGLIVRSGTKVTADVINAGSRLKIIGRAGTGVDNIDCNAATQRGVIVMNTPGGNTMSAAEHTCTLLLAMSRHVSSGSASLRAGRWDRKKFMGNEVLGKTLAIIGLGRIGKEVATRMQAFGMTTIGYDPIIPGSVSAEFNVEWLPLEEIWPRADYITVHTPLIPQTRNLLSDETFAKCKTGVRVINCARGGIISEDALLRALQSGKCGGAGLDVFVEEPPTNLALVEHPLVTSTPHLGASTVEAQSRVASEIAEQFVDFRDGKSLFGAINAQALSNALSSSSRPWVALGTALGKLGAAMCGSDTPRKVQITTRGSGLKSAGSYLGAAALVGLLKSQSSNGLNLVSAPALGKDLGVEVTTTHAEREEMESVTLVVSESLTLSGSVTGTRPILIAVNGHLMSTPPALQGQLLLYASKDVPDQLTTVIGALQTAGARVQSFTASVSPRDSGDGLGWTVLQLTSDSPTPQCASVLAPHVHSVFYVELS